MSYDPKAPQGIITDLAALAANQYVAPDQTPGPATQPILPPLAVTVDQPGEYVAGADGSPKAACDPTPGCRGMPDV
jgi:hypothetical protein